MHRERSYGSSLCSLFRSQFADTESCDAGVGTDYTELQFQVDQMTTTLNEEEDTPPHPSL